MQRRTGRSSLPCRVAVFFEEKKKSKIASYPRAEPVLYACPKSRPDSTSKFLSTRLTAWALSANFRSDCPRPEGRGRADRIFADAAQPRPTNLPAKTHSPTFPARTRACAYGILKALGLERVQGSALVSTKWPPEASLYSYLPY